MKKFLLASFLVLSQLNTKILAASKIVEVLPNGEEQQLEVVPFKERKDNPESKMFKDLSEEEKEELIELTRKQAMQLSLEKQHEIIKEVRKIEKIREETDRVTFLTTVYKTTLNLTSPATITTTIKWVALTLSILFIKGIITSGEITKILVQFKKILKEFAILRGIDLGEKGLNVGTWLLCLILGGCKL